MDETITTSDDLTAGEKELITEWLLSGRPDWWLKGLSKCRQCGKWGWDFSNCKQHEPLSEFRFRFETLSKWYHETYPLMDSPMDNPMFTATSPQTNSNS